MGKSCVPLHVCDHPSIAQKTASKYLLTCGRGSGHRTQKVRYSTSTPRVLFVQWVLGHLPLSSDGNQAGGCNDTQDSVTSTSVKHLFALHIAKMRRFLLFLLLFHICCCFAISSYTDDVFWVNVFPLLQQACAEHFGGTERRRVGDVKWAYYLC